MGTSVFVVDGSGEAPAASDDNEDPLGPSAYGDPLWPYGVESPLDEGNGAPCLP